MTEQNKESKGVRLNGFPATGVYAGPLTQRAMDYDGHLTIGIQISDPAADGSCLFMNLDEHMQVYITPVLASSIAPYDPPEPPPDPECTEAELADTRKNLEWLLKLQIDHGISSIGDLRACALTMSDLADVIELQGGHIVPVYDGTVCTEYADDGTPMIDGRKIYDRIKEPPMYSKDLVCLKCDHNYWTIKEGGFPRPICELDKTEYLDKTSCENFTPDTRNDEGRFH